MNLGELINDVRTYTRLKDVNGNPNPTIKKAIQRAYEQLVADVTADNRHALVEVHEPFTLQAIYTELPANVFTILRVEDITGLGSGVMGTPLSPVEPDESFRTGRQGYTIMGHALAVVNMGWEGKSLRLFFRPAPEKLEKDSQVPRLLPPENHVALFWKTVEMLQGSNHGAPTAYVLEQALTTRFQLLVNVRRKKSVGR